jgi:hypothetical protein
MAQQLLYGLQIDWKSRLGTFGGLSTVNAFTALFDKLWQHFTATLCVTYE